MLEELGERVCVRDRFYTRWQCLEQDNEEHNARKNQHKSKDHPIVDYRHPGLVSALDRSDQVQLQRIRVFAIGEGVGCKVIDGLLEGLLVVAGFLGGGDFGRSQRVSIVDGSQRDVTNKIHGLLPGTGSEERKH